MEGRDHLIIGFGAGLLYAAATGSFGLLGFALAALAALAALFPDIDHWNGEIRRWALLPAVAGLWAICFYLKSGSYLILWAVFLLGLGFLHLFTWKTGKPHRGRTHTLAAAFLTSLPLLQLSPSLAFSWILGYWSHLMADRLALNVL